MRRRRSADTRADPETTTFITLVQDKRRRIVMDIATACRGRDVREVEEELRLRLDGMGVGAEELTRWAEQISGLPSVDDPPTA